MSQAPCPSLISFSSPFLQSLSPSSFFVSTLSLKLKNYGSISTCIIKKGRRTYLGLTTCLHHESLPSCLLLHWIAVKVVIYETYLILISC